MDINDKFLKFRMDTKFNQDSLPVDSEATVTLENDFLTAKLILTPPLNGGNDLTERDILFALAASGITRGIDREVLNNIAKSPVYNKSIVIAQGKKPVNGSNGKLIFSPNSIENMIIPTEQLEFEYIDKDEVQFVKKDEVICHIIPPTKGVEGYDLIGKILTAVDGSPISYPIGENTRMSQDKIKIIANCDGHVITKNKKVSVSPCKILDEVLPEIGDMSYDGTLVIRGNVKGVTIKAAGDIIVYGIVEDATLLSNSSIWLFRGIIGSKSKVLASCNLTAEYIENIQVKTGGNLFSNRVLNCHIQCEGAVTLLGSEGSMIGGICQAEKNFKAMQIGSKSHMLTRVNITGPSAMEKEQRTIRRELSEATKTREKLDVLIKSLGTYVGMTEEKKRETVVRTLISKKSLDVEIDVMEERMKVLKERLLNGIVGDITVKNKIYNNVVLDIDGIIFKNALERGKCTFYKNQDKIAIRTCDTKKK